MRYREDEKLLKDYATSGDVFETLVQLGSNVKQLRSTRSCAEFLIELKEIDSQCISDPNISILYLLHRNLQSLSSRVIKSTHIDSTYRTKLQERIQDQIRNITASVHTAARASLRALSVKRSDEASSEPQGSENEWASAINNGLKVYEIEPTLPDVLNIFEIFVEPLQSRFKYHFDSNRPTNRLDKPEWPLQHVAALLEQNHDFVLATFQQPLNEFASQKGLYAPHEFIRALLPMVRESMIRSTFAVVDDSSLLGHILDEIKRFDDTLRSEHSFRNRDLSRWPGLAGDVLTSQVFTSWLAFNDTFVKSRYHSIIAEEDAFEIKESVDPSSCDIAPNPSSLKIIDLFEASTKRSVPLEGLAHHHSFISSVQIVLLDSYLEKIRASTDAFDNLVNGFSGGFPSADVMGLNGLRRLCRQISGVSNVLAKLREWADDPFYIHDGVSGENESCFNQQIADYTDLKERIRLLIDSQIERELVQDLRTYLRLQTWSSDEAPLAGIATSNTSSPQLILFYVTIKSVFQYLTTVASPVFLHRVYISVASSLDRLLWTKLLLKNKFARRGALQLKRDLYEMWATFAPFVLRPEQGMRMMCDVLQILDSALSEEGNDKYKAIAAARSDDELRRANITILSRAEVHSVLDHLLFEHGYVDDR